jgi:hypothetical protein
LNHVACDPCGRRSIRGRLPSCLLFGRRRSERRMPKFVLQFLDTTDGMQAAAIWGYRQGWLPMKITFSNSYPLTFYATTFHLLRLMFVPKLKFILLTHNPCTLAIFNTSKRLTFSTTHFLAQTVQQTPCYYSHILNKF